MPQPLADSELSFERGRAYQRLKAKIDSLPPGTEFDEARIDAESMLVDVHHISNLEDLAEWEALVNSAIEDWASPETLAEEKSEIEITAQDLSDLIRGVTIKR